MLKRNLMIAALAAMVLVVNPQTTFASNSVSTEQLNAMLQQATGENTDYAEGIADSKAVKVQDAAVMVERALADKDKTTVEKMTSTKQYYNAKKLKRVKDLAKASKSKREALLVMYSKGIFVGKSCGQFTNKRELFPTRSMSKETVESVVARVANKSKRYGITQYGQVKRTTNLPKNSKQFAYVLADVPNWFYDVKLRYQGWYMDPYGKLDSGAESPKTVLLGKEKWLDTTYLDTWMEKAHDNVELRLSMNYKTVDKTDWSKKLRNTFYWFGDDRDADRTKDINNFVKNFIKKLKLQTECKYVYVDRSAVYWNGHPVVRVAAKFRYTGGNIKTTNNETDYIYGGGSEGNFFGKYKKGEWITVVSDIELYSFTNDLTYKNAAPEIENRLYSLKFQQDWGFYAGKKYNPGGK